MIKNDFIPVYVPYVAKNQKKYVLDCLDSNWISSRGKYVDLFEEGLSKYIGVNYAVTVCNGTVALMLAYASLGLKSGDDVIVPSLTYCATISQLQWLGINPVLVDSNDNFQISLVKLRQHITRRTKAVIVPQLYGDSPNMNTLVEFCRSNDLYLIEDSAESFGCSIKDKKLGSFGDISTTSFFGNKTLTTGEGGACFTDNYELFKELKLLKSQAHIGNFVHRGPGFNFRMCNIQAAIGLAQLEEIDSIIEKKKNIARYYRNTLSKEIGRIIPKEVDTSSEWMPVFTLPDTMEYSKFQYLMQEKGIETRPVFTPIHLMKDFYIDYKFSLDTSERIYRRGFNLPSWPDLSKEQLEKIVSSVNEVVKVIG